MRNIPAAILDALAGSTGNARLQFNAWYDGLVTRADLPVSNYRASFDSGRDVQGDLVFTVLDDTGTLSPWGISDPLGVGGAHIQTQLVVGNQSVPLGFQRISRSTPDETWHVVGGSYRWVQNSAEISVEAKDVFLTVQGARFMSAEAPAAGGTCISEITRLLQGLADVDPNGVTDVAIPSTVVYREDRLAAVLDLCDALGVLPRLDPSGVLVLTPRPATSSWTALGGVEGSFMKITRSMQVDDFPNACVSTNTAADGTALYGVATQATGDGYFDGPHGRWPVFHNANLATTQTAVQKDAATSLANLQRKRVISVPATVAWNPAVETGDIITLRMPILDGTTLDLPGRVRSISWKGTTSVPADMDIVLDCQPADVQVISTAVRRTQLFGLR